ncbi:MAG: hypothetical protein LBD16_06540 [Oscillospiraceae bacterium]|jgi:ubiquitin|nr:hypothetical protein [Oscillospiraceae bacterium]
MLRHSKACFILLVILVLFSSALADDLLNMSAPDIEVESAEEVEEIEGEQGQFPWEEGGEAVALYLTNIKQAQDGLGTWRYTLALPSDKRIDETDYQMESMAMLSRRLISFDGSMGDPNDADVLLDISATVDCGWADAYAVLRTTGAIHIYKNGEMIRSEQTSPYYTGVVYMMNARGVPALQYTRNDGTTALIPFTPKCVVLFTGAYTKLNITADHKDDTIAFGAGATIEFFRADCHIILHNSGLVEESEYSPAGISMLGIAYDEDSNPITIDSGMFSTGPRPPRGGRCAICGAEYNGKIEEQREWHHANVCEHAGCKFGGFWSSCAKEGSLYYVPLHGAAERCPYGLCSNCSDKLCVYCERDLQMGRVVAGENTTLFPRSGDK